MPTTTNSTYHIPFPKNFLRVNTPVKKAAVTIPVTIPEPAGHGFLSNRPITARHQSISSVSSVVSVAPSDSASTISPPSSPPSKALESPILGPKIFAPLAVNTKHSLPPASAREMSAAERKRRMSFERHTFLSNRD